MTGESKSLPIEVLDRTFQLLPQKSLKECRMVCQLWLPHATRQFMNHVHFRHEDEIYKFLDCQLRMTSSVKKMEIEYIDLDNFPKRTFNQLMMKVPNLQELVLNNSLFPLHRSKYIKLPTSLTSFNATYVFDYVYQDVNNFIKVLTKSGGLIQNLYIEIEDIRNWDLVAFFASFPKLTELTVDSETSFRCLANCLPIIQAIPLPKSITLFLGDDMDPDFNATQFKQKLGGIEKLEFDAYEVLPHTFSFMIHNFVGLKEINVKIFENGVIEELQYSTALVDFLDFVFSIDKHKTEFEIDHKLYLHCLSNIISKAFTQLPKNSQNTSRQLYIEPMYSQYSSENVSHHFELESYRDYCNRLQRRIKWSFMYNRVHRNELLKCITSLDKMDADIFVFDMCRNPFQSGCFDMFLELLSLLIEPKRVLLKVSINSEWCKYKSFKKIYHITQLEIQATVDSEAKCNNLALFLDTLPNLKMLRLIYTYDKLWYPKYSPCMLDLPLLNLETLYLDVTLVVYEAKKRNRSNFLLVVETNTLLYSYEVSVSSLQATKLVLDTETHHYTKFYLNIQNVQNLYLQVLDDMIKMGPISPYFPLSSSCIKKETLISL